MGRLLEEWFPSVDSSKEDACDREDMFASLDSSEQEVQAGLAAPCVEAALRSSCKPAPRPPGRGLGVLLGPLACLPQLRAEHFAPKGGPGRAREERRIPTVSFSEEVDYQEAEPGELLLEWMWADAEALPLPGFRSLAAVNPWRWSRGTPSDTVRDLLCQEEQKRRVTLRLDSEDSGMVFPDVKHAAEWIRLNFVVKLEDTVLPCGTSVASATIRVTPYRGWPVDGFRESKDIAACNSDDEACHVAVAAVMKDPANAVAEVSWSAMTNTWIVKLFVAEADQIMTFEKAWAHEYGYMVYDGLLGRSQPDVS